MAIKLTWLQKRNSPLPFCTLLTSELTVLPCPYQRPFDPMVTWWRAQLQLLAELGVADDMWSALRQSAPRLLGPKLSGPVVSAVSSLAEGVGTDHMWAGGVGSLTEGVGTDCVGAKGVGADFVARCSLLSFSMAVRGHPQLYVPLYIPHLLFIFHLHFALLIYLFVTIWLPP